MVDKEFSDTLTKITQLGYGIVYIGHEKVRVDTDGQISYRHITPDMSDRCTKIINRMVDIIAYIGFEGTNRIIYLRQTTIEEGKQITEIQAGNRFPYLDNKIELGYESLVNAISNAMEESASKEGFTMVEEKVLNVAVEEEIDFKKVKATIGRIAKKLAQLDEEEGTSAHMTVYKNIVDNYLGKNKLVKDCDESQAEHLTLVAEDLIEYIKSNNLNVKYD